MADEYRVGSTEFPKGDCMSLLGWVVGAMVLDEVGRQQDEIEEHDRALRERDRRIFDLESRLKRLEGRSDRRRPFGLYGSH